MQNSLPTDINSPSLQEAQGELMSMGRLFAKLTELKVNSFDESLDCCNFPQSLNGPCACGYQVLSMAKT